VPYESNGADEAAADVAVFPDGAGFFPDWDGLSGYIHLERSSVCITHSP